MLCVGATHAFGGLLPALAAARKLLAPGGRVIVSEGYWEGEPSPGAVEMLGDLADLPTTVDTVTADGWRHAQFRARRWGAATARRWRTTSGGAIVAG